jgi:hypothetical protein
VFSSVQSFRRESGLTAHVSDLVLTHLAIRAHNLQISMLVHNGLNTLECQAKIHIDSDDIDHMSETSWQCTALRSEHSPHRAVTIFVCAVMVVNFCYLIHWDLQILFLS